MAGSVDLAIRRLSDASNPELPGDLNTIVGHLATVGFAPTQRPAKVWDRTGYGTVGSDHPSNPGKTITDQTPLTAAEAHVVKHIHKGCLKAGTTTHAYLRDITSAVTSAFAEHYVGVHEWGDERALAMTPVRFLGARTCVIPNARESLVVVYSTRSSAIVSAHSRPPSTALTSWQTHRRLKGI